MIMMFLLVFYKIIQILTSLTGLLTKILSKQLVRHTNPEIIHQINFIGTPVHEDGATLIK